MKLLRKLIPVSFLCLGVLGCNNDPFLEEQNGMESGSNTTIKEISVSLPEIPSTADTRTEFMMSNTKVTSSWAKNDTIGIFPGNGNQVIFPIVDGVGTNTAIFDGGDWGLKAGHSYAAYYPFNKTNFFRNNKTILMDYTGQAQEGNRNSAHLGAYDYLASGQVKPDSPDSLNLKMQRLGCLVMLELTVPKSETYTSLTLTSSGANFITKAELDISGSVPQMAEKETSSTMTLDLKDITLKAGDILQAYLMCAPVNLTSGTLSVALRGNIIYNIELEPKNLEAGKPYKFSGSYDPPIPVGNIEFADPLVKQICVSQWDTNKDGELSYDEAARLTTIPVGLFFNKAITSFDELRYFTNLNVIGNNAFNGCRRLTSITLPERVTEIAWAAFSSCSGLTSITIPDSVTRIGESVFSGCSSLTSITFPEGVTSIGEAAFSGCSSLTSVTFPEGVTSIGDSAFNGCSNLTSITIEGVTTIGESAFANCSSLTSITIPDGGVTTIGNWAFSNCTKLTSVIIPNGVTKIMQGVFSWCSSLTSITIPDSVTEIDGSAFFDCISVSRVICYATSPPLIVGVGFTLLDWNQDYPLYVPAESIDDYLNAPGWEHFDSRIYAITE